MRRLHLHIGVEHLNESISFYETLFKSKPTKLKEDYAQWVLEDPKINFAISTRAEKIGVEHLGIQVDNSVELNKIREDLDHHQISTHSDGEVTCCYAKSEKSWVTDPSGIAWETFRTTAHSNTFYKDNNDKTEIDSLETLTTSNSGSACC